MKWIFKSQTLLSSGVGVALAVCVVYGVVYIASRVTQGRADLSLALLGTGLLALSVPKISALTTSFIDSLRTGGLPPQALLERTLERLKLASESQAILEQFAAILRSAVKAQACEIQFQAGSATVIAASSGLPPVGRTGNSALEIPVIQGNRLMGRIMLFDAGESLTPTERKFLENLAHQVGLAWQNLQLGSEVRKRLEDVQARSERIVQARREIVKAQEEERRRLKKDLHDGAQQYLVGLGLRLQVASQLIDRDSEGAKAAIAEALQITTDAITSLNSLFTEAGWEDLVDAGPAEALKKAAERLGLQAAITVSLGRQSLEIEIPIFLTCLEALQNVAKHSRTNRVKLHLFDDEGSAGFSLSDAGIGFNYSEVEGGGLENMRERITRARGKLRIHSELGKGTTVTGRIPVWTADLPS